MYLNVTTFSAKNGHFEPLRFKFYPWSPVHIRYEQHSADLQVDYRIGLTNLVFIGSHLVTRGTRTSPSRIPLNVQGCEVSLEILGWYGDIRARLSESLGTEVTAHLITKASIADWHLVTKLSEDLCLLLSFASGTWVAPIYEDALLDNRPVATILPPAKTLPYSNADRVIDTRNGNELREFIETAYGNYVKAKNELGMDIVIEYYVHSKSARILEIKYLIACIGMECLKSYLSGYFAARNKNPDLRFFRGSLESLFQELSMPYRSSELDFIDIRGEIVHTGRFPTNIDSVEEYYKLLNLYERTVLTVLGYRGKPYLNAAKRYTKETVP